MSDVNIEYYTQLKARIEGCSSCDSLKAVAAEALSAIAAQQQAIQDQINALQPMLALITPPTSLNAIISWVGNFINAFIKPVTKPYTVYISQLTLLAAELAEISSAIQNASIKFPNCSIT
jgi:hypothetical protein